LSALLEKPHVLLAAWMKQTFPLIPEADEKAKIQTATGKSVKSSTDFPCGPKFRDAFKPQQSDDTKHVKIMFHMTTTPSLSNMKNRRRKLVDHLQTHQICSNESLSGSDEESVDWVFHGFPS
jgi:hypothetical protein